MKMNAEKLIQDFLGPLYVCLNRGRRAYQNYLASGKKYKFALVLKENNERIRELLLSNSYVLPVLEFEGSLDIIDHIDLWCTLWEDFNAGEKFSMDDTFSFECSSHFPSRAEELIVNFYLKSKG